MRILPEKSVLGAGLVEMSPREQGSVLRQPLETGSSQVMGQWEQTVAGDRQTSLRLVGLLRESIGYTFT